MVDTVRTDAEILALLLDNTTGAISAQDARDAFVTSRAFNPAWATVGRTLVDRVGAVVSVKDFGASGTGEVGNNDTAAFQAAIDYVRTANTWAETGEFVGGIVYIPVGWYKITNITMKTRVGLVGASRTGSIVQHKDGIGHTGAMITLVHNAVNHTDLHNFTLVGGGDTNLNAIHFVNDDNDTVINADCLFDIGDTNHRMSYLDITGFSDGTGIIIGGSRATHMNDIHVTHCKNGIDAASSDGKFVNLDVNWIGQRGIVISGGNNKLTNCKVWYCGTDGSYALGDAYVINSARNTLMGCEAQDVSRHGLLINTGDHNIIEGMLLDNIGNFFIMQGQGIQHPSGTIVSAIRLDGAAQYNRVGASLGQRSVTSDLHAGIYVSQDATDNYISLMRNPAHIISAGEDVHVDRGTAINNIVEINGRKLNLVVSSIATGTDDAVQVVSTTQVIVDGTNSGIQNTLIHGLRFLVPDLPQGATIISARLQVAATITDAGTMGATIWCEDADAPATFQAVNGNISGRVKTSASVSWANIPGWTSTHRGADQLTPDLKTIVQEVVDRGGFGGVIALIIEGDQPGPAQRAYAFFEHSQQAEATLTVVYN